MRRSIGWPGAGLALAAALFAGPLAAQQPGRPSEDQMRRMQQHMEQMSQPMRRMEQIRERSLALEADMTRRMERLHQQASVDPSRLAQHKRMREMARDMAGAGEGMERAMERAREMIRDPAAMGDQEMQRDMDRLRQHWEDIAGRMEEGLQIMERVRTRLSQP